MDSNILLFNGHEYRLDRIKAASKQAPAIQVSIDKLNDTDDKRFKSVLKKPDDLFHNGEVLFYRQEGKFTIIGGQWKAAANISNGDTIIRGRLLSGPVLKKARLSSPEDEVEVPVVVKRGKFSRN